MRIALEKIFDVICRYMVPPKWNADQCRKTELLFCDDRRQLAQISESPEITLKGESLKSTNQVKNLGVTMDSTLSWTPHVRNIANRCFGILVGLSHARHALPVQVMPRLIDSLALSQLRYCVQVYGNGNSVNLDLIQNVLNFAARIISNRQKYDHITDVLHKLGWLNARQSIEYFDLCMLYSMVSTGQPHLLASQFKFNRDVRERSTRQSNEIHSARPRTNHKKRTFVYRASALINIYDIKNSNSLTSNSVCTFSYPVQTAMLQAVGQIGSAKRKGNILNRAIRLYLLSSI